MIYSADQNAEASHKGDAFTWSRTPASEWRWLPFSIKAPAALVGRTPIQSALAAKDEHDQGAGSSLAALRRRALIEVQDDIVQTVLGPVPRVRVKMTTLGRATARAGLGHTAPKSPPRGLLSEWLWENLVRLFRAGPDGMPEYSPRGTPPEERTPSHKALFFLQQMDRQGGRLVETKQMTTGAEPFKSYMGHMVTPTERRVLLTAAGRAHYEQHVRCYAELWPGVDAPVPDELPEGAHRSLDDHKISKPRGLLARPPFLLLAALAEADIANELYIRQEWSRRWTDYGRTPPAELTALPSGLTNTAVRHITRSAAAPAKLLEFRDGPLAAQKDVPPHLFPRHSSPDLQLTVLHLTDAGRTHYATHLDTYRGLYDDVETPDAPAEWKAGAVS
ncbi:hypothetical protein [Streptomyces showdoensis]|uniref:hypothetical protein n=1 Tax=Streptomyces showdoensis TaxID=68268 RepID=UPI00103F64DA|nr:hypothetical protein [Streptomyces showdoensis]